MVTGKVNTMKIGLKKIFNTAKTEAITTADQKLGTTTPGTMYALTNIASVVINNFNNPRMNK